MSRSEVLEYYQKAQKMGQRDYREKTAAGESPYLPVLDDLLKNVQVENQLPLGLIEVHQDGGAYRRLCRQFHAAAGCAHGVRRQMDRPLRRPSGRGHPRPGALL